MIAGWTIVIAIAFVAMIVAAARYLSQPQLATRRHAELVALCHGDLELADRLVAGQAARRPAASRRAHIDDAIDKLLYDRRR